jgi:hypothetical protein
VCHRERLCTTDDPNGSMERVEEDMATWRQAEPHKRLPAIPMTKIHCHLSRDQSEEYRPYWDFPTAETVGSDQYCPSLSVYRDG